MVYGPQLLLESHQKSIEVLKTLLDNVYAHHVVTMLFNNARDHFFVADLNVGGNSVTIYDSIFKRDIDSASVRKMYSSSALEALYREVFHLTCGDLTWMMATKMPQQRNSSDCGIFAMEVARSLVATYISNANEGLVSNNDGYSKLKPDNVMKYRRRLCRELREKHVDLNARP